MRSNFSFGRAVAFALVAIGTVASLSSDTFAVNRTWTNGYSLNSGNRGKWGTAFTSNWAGNVVPTTGDLAYFGSNLTSTYSIAVQPNTSVGGIRLTTITTATTTGYSFNTNPISIAGQGIQNTSGKVVTFGGGAVLLANQTWSGSGNGSAMVFNNVDVNGFTLNTSTPTTINTLINTGTVQATINVQGGDLVVAGGGGPGTTPVNFTVSSGFLTTYNSGGAGYNSSGSDLAVSGNGTYNNTQVGSDPGVTNWDVVTLGGSGTIDLMGIGGVLTTNSYTQSGTASTIKQYVGWDNAAPVGERAIHSTVASTDGAGHNTGPLTLGGILNIDMAGLGTNATPVGTTWNLFQGTNAGGAAASNFASVVLSNDQGSAYNGLTFTQYGSEWYTAPGSDGTWLVFQAQTGNLVVVPEPSTMVFAGLGVAMSGWTMWKKRRLAKLLAAKAG